MKQQIKYNLSYLNDLPPDNKEFKKKPLTDHSINFENQNIRDGVKLRKDGFIITNRGREQDSALLDEQDPDRLLNEAEKSLQEEIRRIKAPDLDTVTAFKNVTRRDYVDIDFGKMKGRYSTSVLPNGTKIPAAMNYSGRRFESDYLTDKSLQMNLFIEQSRHESFESSFNKKTNAQISKMRHR